MHGCSAAQQGKKFLAGPQTLKWRAPSPLDWEGQAPLLADLLPQHRPPGHPPAHLLLPAPVEARACSVQCYVQPYSKTVVLRDSRAHRARECSL